MSIKPIGLTFNSKINFGNTTQQMQNIAKETSKNNAENTKMLDSLSVLAFRGDNIKSEIKKYEVPDEIKANLNNFKATSEVANTAMEYAHKQINLAVENAQELFNEVTELFKKGDEVAPDGTVLRKITTDDTSDTRKIMEEFSQDGKLFRKSTFVNDILDNVQEGFEELPDGTKKIAKEIDFEDGKPSLYQEGYEELPDDTREVAKEFKLTDKGWQQVSE